MPRGLQLELLEETFGQTQFMHRMSAARRIAHTLKGAADQLGADALAEAARNLEQRLRGADSFDPNELHRHCVAIDDTIRRLTVYC